MYPKMEIPFQAFPGTMAGAGFRKENISASRKIGFSFGVRESNPIEITTKIGKLGKMWRM